MFYSFWDDTWDDSVDDILHAIMQSNVVKDGEDPAIAQTRRADSLRAYDAIHGEERLNED